MKPDARKPLKSAARLFCLGGLALVAVGLAYNFLTPPVYRAVAKVRLQNHGLTRSDRPGFRSGTASEAPLLATECQVMRSEILLTQVVANLDLSKVWGTRDALAELRRIVRVENIPKTSVIEISVTSADREEPARIANELARVYLAGHESKRRSFTVGKVQSVQQEWELGNEELREARARLAQVVADIHHGRATNGATYYDAATVEALRSKVIELDADLTRRETALARLRALNPDELRQVLPLTVTNALLNGVLSQWLKAQRRWTELKDSKGPDSPEFRGAGAALQELDQRSREVVQGVLSNLETEVKFEKDEREQLAGKLIQPGTDVVEFSTNNPAYVAALRDVQARERQRDLLKAKLDVDSLEAVYPLYLAAEMVEAADSPARPSSPDGRITLGLISAGGLALAIGGGLWLAAGRRVKPVRTTSAPTAPAAS